MWITYDDLQSNTFKNNYTLQKKLLGAMLQDLSGDRNAELIGNTYNALFGRYTPTEPTTTTRGTGTTATTTATTTGTGTTITTTIAVTTATTTSSGDILPCTVNK